MNNRITLNEAIESVIKCQRENGHPESYIIDLQRNYNALLIHAKQLETKYLTEELITQFLSDNKNLRTGEYCHTKFLAHNRSIRFIKSYLETGKVVIDKYHEPKQDEISDNFKKALELYDKKEAASGLSVASLIKNRRPLKYLLEYMTSLGYKNLSDIKPGDTTRAIQDMLDKHYNPTSLVTAISGMRRFYEMFPEIQRFKLEIPSRLPRKRSILDVYTSDEQDKIVKYLSSSNISRRDAAICLLSFETGIRNVDICNLKLNNVDWKHSVIHITQSKTQRPLYLPIRSSYGNAMVDYLLNERPKCDEEYFFLSVHAPYTRIHNTRHIIKDAVIAAGVETNNRLTGTRMFRHNAATRMLNKGIPLSTISEELGHKCLDSTMIYLSTDKETMASLTLEMPKVGD